MTQPIDLAKLKELIEKATPGPWGTDHMPNQPDDRCMIVTNIEVIAELHGHNRMRNSEHDMRYIAAADPQTVLALIAEIECRDVLIRELRDWTDIVIGDPKKYLVTALLMNAKARKILEGK